MLSTGLKYFLFISIIGLLWTPQLVKQFHLVKEEKLKGYFEIPDSTFVLNDSNWLSGNFQNKYETWFNYNMGLHLTGVRLSNQLNFWMREQFPNVVVGKEYELMENNYIEAYLGRDFVGTDSIERECMRLHQLKEELEKRGIKFFVAVAPNKSRIRAKNIPDFYHPEIRRKGNYEFYLEGFKKHGVPVLNFEEWFERIQDTSRYPLFTNLGVHWGNYGAMLCSDSLMKYIEVLAEKRINIPVIKSVFTSDNPQGTEYDLADVLNLMLKVKPRDSFVSFSWDFVQDTAKYFPDVMVIGDSYYWNIMNFGVPKLFSKKFRYMYYNSTAYYNDGSEKQVDQLNLKEEILGEKIIFFLYTEPNFRNLGNGFTEKSLSALLNGK